MMRQSETMRAASRLLLSHPIVCLLAALAAAVVVGVLGPIKVVHAADVAKVEGESFTNKPLTGTTVVNDTLFSEGQALKFTADGKVSDTVTCSVACDVVLMARAGHSGGTPSFSVNGSAPQAITTANQVAPEPYKFMTLPAGSTNTPIEVTASGTGTGHNAFLDVARFPAADGGGGGTPPDGGTDPVFVGAGDIAGCGADRTGDQATAKLLHNIVDTSTSPTTVFTTGDNAYPDGTLPEYQTCYGPQPTTDQPNWGEFKAITMPSLGNHEYQTPGASGYFDYFSATPSAPVPNDPNNNQFGLTFGKGYYSYDLGTDPSGRPSWHIVALNSNCKEVGCGATSTQVKWLEADLRAHPAQCTLAYWHHPLFSSGSTSGGNSNVKPFWNALYAAKADVVLNGHVHNYERFDPQDAGGRADPAQGISEFVVGTGGYSLNSFKTIVANSVAKSRNASAYGVLKLTLHPNGYDWEFVPEAGKTFSDNGSASCEPT